MKKITITIAVIILIAFACKKNKSQYCYWEGMKGSRAIYIWEHNKPTDAQVKAVQDTCFCTISLKQTCLPCKPQTDANGNDIPCD